jgi:HD-like signal output (HDOD) protein/CheY-like chemotaxis protein
MRILIADDETVSREKLRLIMTHFGEVEAFESGAEAFMAYEAAHEAKTPFNLIMLDINMPEKNGIQVLLEIRASETLLNLSNKEKAIVLMVTSKTDKGHIVSCVQAGCDSFIAKPFDLPVVSEKLAKFGITKLSTDTQKQNPADEEPPDENQADLFRDASLYLNRGEIHLPTLPRIQARFTELSKTGATFAQMSDLMKKDLALSAELIRLSNSAYYRGFVENKTLDQAIGRLGFAAIEQVIAEICGRKLHSMSQKKYRRLIERLLKHSLACAFSCDVIARIKKVDLPVDPFTLGLMHDIGKLAFLQIISEMEGKGKFHSGISTEQILEAIEAYHELFGSKLLEKWKYAEIYVQTVLYHDSLDQVETVTDALGLVYLGNIVAKRKGFDILEENQSPPEVPDMEMLNGLKMTPAALDQVGSATLDFMETVQTLF